MINRMKVEDKSEQTIKSYVWAIDRLIRFHGLIHPKELDIDEVLDFLVSLTEHQKVNWRTNKMYVAGLRYYWSQTLNDQDFADRLSHPHLMMRFPSIASIFTPAITKASIKWSSAQHPKTHAAM